MNYFRFYVGDYLKDTSRLSLLEHGAYAMLLAYYFAEERPIPADLEEVYRMVRAISPAERRAIEKVLCTYFAKAEDGWHNARADHEIEVSRTARENGARGGRPATGRETGPETGPLTGQGGGSGHPPASNRQPPPPPHQRAERSRGSRLPPDWEPTAEQLAWAKKERPDLNLHSTAATFRDHWIAAPGSRGVKLDWEATWRNWVRSEKRAPLTGVGPAPKTIPCGYCSIGIRPEDAWMQSPQGRACKGCSDVYHSTGAWPVKQAA